MSYPLRLDRALWMVCAFSWDKRQIHLCLILEQRMGGHHFSDCHPRILFSPFFHFLKSPPSFTLRLSATLALSLSLLNTSEAQLSPWLFFFSSVFVASHVILYCFISFRHKQICLPPHLASIVPPRVCSGSCIWPSSPAILRENRNFLKIWWLRLINELTSTQPKYKESRIFFPPALFSSQDN